MNDITDLIIQGKPKAPSKFIVMGDPMSGKTTLAAKSPKPLFLSTDGNAAKAGLSAVNVKTLDDVRKVIEFFQTDQKQYETLVVDTIEGIVDLFETSVLITHNNENPSNKVVALNDVPYGKLTGQLNRRVQNFAERLWQLPCNVIVLTYMKRQTDDVSGSIVLASELKSIRQFTKFADAIMMTSHDGEKFMAQVTNKRTVMAGEVEYGSIEPFLKAAGWDLPVKKTKVGSAKK